MPGDTADWMPLISALIGAGGGVVAAILTLRVQKKKFQDELRFQRNKLQQELNSHRERLKTEFATEESVEAALRHFLEIYDLPYRSFPMIRHHIGGFESNELRRLLVRTGAVRFMAADGTELWALRDRVADDFKRSRWKHEGPPINKVSESQLFPGAFNDPNEY